MKPKTMILMVVAVGCGLGASYMTSRLLADRNKPVQEVPKVDVLVAKTRVPSWQAIKEPEKFFEIKQFPQDVAPKKPVSKFEDIKDKRLRVFLDEGKALTEDDLVSKDQNGLEGDLQPGQRATALKVNAEAIIGGFILPGARVDVVCTMRGQNASSKVILQNMLVLAVDAVDRNNGETKTILAQTVTIATSPEEGLRLALASSLGDLRLFLRNPGDDEMSQQLVVRPDDLDRPITPGTPRGGPENSETELPGAGTRKVELPAIPPEVKKTEAKAVEKEPKPAGKAPLKVKREERDDPRPIKRAPRVRAEADPAAPTELNTRRAPKKHAIFIREGATARREVIDTVRREDTGEEEEVEGGAAPGQPARQQPVAQPRPQPAQPKAGQSPAPRTAPSSKMGRSRTKYGS